MVLMIALTKKQRRWFDNLWNYPLNLPLIPNGNLGLTLVNDLAPKLFHTIINLCGGLLFPLDIFPALTLCHQIYAGKDEDG
jgi:hypothetical protein